jgi:hypothetical protein
MISTGHGGQRLGSDWLVFGATAWQNHGLAREEEKETEAITIPSSQDGGLSSDEEGIGATQGF